MGRSGVSDCLAGEKWKRFPTGIGRTLISNCSGNLLRDLKQTDRTSPGQELHHFAADRFPVCRSINKNGFDAAPAHMSSNLGSTLTNGRRVSPVVRSLEIISKE